MVNGGRTSGKIRRSAVNRRPRRHHSHQSRGQIRPLSRRNLRVSHLILIRHQGRQGRRSRRSRRSRPSRRNPQAQHRQARPVRLTRFRQVLCLAAEAQASAARRSQAAAQAPAAVAFQAQAVPRQRRDHRDQGHQVLAAVTRAPRIATATFQAEPAQTRFRFTKTVSSARPGCRHMKQSTRGWIRRTMPQRRSGQVRLIPATKSSRCRSMENCRRTGHRSPA